MGHTELNFLQTKNKHNFRTKISPAPCNVHVYCVCRYQFTKTAVCQCCFYVRWNCITCQHLCFSTSSTLGVICPRRRSIRCCPLCLCHLSAVVILSFASFDNFQSCVLLAVYCSCLSSSVPLLCVPFRLTSFASWAVCRLNGIMALYKCRIIIIIIIIIIITNCEIVNYCWQSVPAACFGFYF